MLALADLGLKAYGLERILSRTLRLFLVGNGQERRVICIPVQQESVREALVKRYPLKGRSLDTSWQEQVEMARRESVNAYVGFLESLSWHYGKRTKVAEGGTQ